MFKSIGSNWALVFLKFAAAFVVTPFTVRALGTDAYGSWVLLNSIVGYLALLVLGTPMTSVRFLSQAAATGDTRRLNQYVSNFLGVYLLMGAICLVVGACLYPSLGRVFPIPGNLLYDARLAFVMVVGATAAGFSLQLPYAILYSHNEFVLANFILGAITVFRTIGTIVLLTWKPSITSVAVIQVIFLLVEFLAAWVVVKKRHPQVVLRVRRMAWPAFRELFVFNVYVLVINVGSQLTYQTGALLIGAKIDVASVAPFSVANSLTLYYVEFLVGIAAVILPMTAQLQARNDMAGVRRLFLQWSKISLCLTTIGVLYLIYVGPSFLGWWIGPEFKTSGGEVLKMLLYSYFLFLPARAVAQPVLTGLGQPDKPAKAFLAVGIMSIVLGFALVGPLGVAGVALGISIPSAAYAIYMIVAAARALDIPLAEYWKSVYLRAAVAGVLLTGILHFTVANMNTSRIPAMAIVGVVTAVSGAGLWYFLVARNDPDFDPIIARLRRR